MTSFDDVAQTMHMPPEGLMALLAGVGLIIIIVTVCCCVRCCKKCRRNAKKKKGPDAKSVQMLGEACKEKVDKENLTEEEKEGVEEENAGKNQDKKPLGNIQYRLDYDFGSGTLNLTVLQCKNLPALDVGGTSDPYVKIYFLPEKKKKFETKVKKKTLNPEFCETFSLKASYAELILKTILFCVYDYDRLSKHDLIGQAKIPLCLVDLGQTIEEWKDLEKVEVDKNALGDICFSIRYVPTTGKLSVVVMEAKNLKKMDVGGGSDPYVKVCLFEGSKRLKKQKTTVKKKTLNPYYNESFSFDLPFEKMQKMSLQVTVVDYDRIGHSDPIGRVVLGMNVTGTELKHWAAMLSAPRRPIAQWHKLRDPDEANEVLTAKKKTDQKPKETV